MLYRRLLVCALLEACSDNGGGTKNGQYAVEDLNGYWVEQTGDTYRAIEFRPPVPIFGGARYYSFEGTIHTDAKPLRNAAFDVDGNTLALYYNSDYYNGEFHSIDAFDGDTLTLTYSETHTYKRASACPIAPRDGAWLWSSLNPMGGAGTTSVTIGPDGPVLAAGAFGYDNDRVILKQRAGCYFWEKIMGLELGNAQPELLYGPDGLPRLAAIRSANSTVQHARWDSTMNDWIFHNLDLSKANPPGRTLGFAIAADGSSWVSHAIMGDFNDFGLGTSHVALDGAVTHSDIIRSGGHHSSRLVLDAAGTPHVAYTNSRAEGLFIARMTGPSTWSIQGPLNPGALYAAEMTGFAMSADGAYHVAWTEYFNSSKEARYTTNASGSWVTHNFAQGSGTAVALDSQDRPVITYIHDPDLLPHIITNEGGAWVDTLMETAGAQGTPAPEAFNSLTSVIIDDNDNVHVGLANVGYATNAY